MLSQKKQIVDQDRSLKTYYNYILCLLGTVLMAIGEGSYLFEIIAYLEHHKVGVWDIGLTNGTFAVTQFIFNLAVGIYYKNSKSKAFMLFSIVILQISTIIIIFQPIGWLVKVSAAVNGFGIGIYIVLIYSTLLAHRPEYIPLGLTVGLYTAGIAAGNAIGAALTGVTVEHYGYGWGFGVSLGGFVFLMIITALTKTPKWITKSESTEPDPTQTSVADAKIEPPGGQWLWKTSLVAAFSMASVITLSGILFPLYALRNGISVATLGFLTGLKMTCAAVVRPFSGVILSKISTFRMTTFSLIAFSLSVASLPHVGLSTGLIINSAIVGLFFGTCRVSSATLAVENTGYNVENNKRIGLYSAAISFGNIATPLMAGWFGGTIDLVLALTVLPIFFLFCFGVGYLYLLFAHRSHK